MWAINRAIPLESSCSAALVMISFQGAVRRLCTYASAHMLSDASGKSEFVMRLGLEDLRHTFRLVQDAPLAKNLNS